MKTKLLSVLIFVLIGSCFDQKQDIAVRVKVVDNESQPIGKASVKINGEVIGVTEQNGMLEAVASVDLSIPAKVEISKQSAIKYYAPFSETYELTEKSNQLPVNATLYSVPKPTAEMYSDAIEKSDDESDFDSGLSEENSAIDIENKSSSFEEQDLLDEGQSNSTGKEILITSGIKENEKKNQIEAAAIPKLPDVSESKSGSNSAKKPVKDVPSQIKVVTFKVDHRGKPVPANVYIGDKERKDFKLACETGKNGKCSVKFSSAVDRLYTILIKADGYLSKELNTRITNRDLIPVSLRKGQSLDIFALTKVYNYTKGLRGIEVHIDGRRAGLTDEFGRYSHQIAGNKSDLIEVKLISRDYYPLEYSTDFVLSGPLNLIKYFTPKTPSPAKVYVAKIRSAGDKNSKISSQTFLDNLNQNIRRAAQARFFKHPVFSEVPASVFQKKSQEFSIDSNTLFSSGWNDTDLKAYIDVIAVPSLITKNKEHHLELSLIDSQGRTLAAAREQVRELNQFKALSAAFADISKKLMAIYPFEGSVTEVRAKELTVNFGSQNGNLVSAGDSVTIYGEQISRDGNTKQHALVAVGSIKKSSKLNSVVTIERILPRAVIREGDLVKLRENKSLRANNTNTTITVYSNSISHKPPLMNANIYLNNEWIGASDAKGNLMIDPSSLPDSGVLKVSRFGYDTVSKSVVFDQAKNIRVELAKQSTFFKIESKPSNATVIIDGTVVGKTPIYTPVKIARGFVKLELSGLSGYKSIEQVLEVDREIVDLTGRNQIVLEQDYLDTANKYIAQKSFKKAISILSKITEAHSDFLVAQHKIGSLYLKELNQPEKSLAYFEKIISVPEVENFNNKSFIGSFVNAGLASFHIGKNLLQDDPKAAASYLVKSFNILEKVKPQIRYLNKDSYQSAFHIVHFYVALSQHKLWELTSEPDLLQKAIISWNNYINLSNPKDAYIKNANAYLAQLEAKVRSQRVSSAKNNQNQLH